MLKNNFLFKNIPVSYKKLFCYSKILSSKPILYFYFINFKNKINFYIKKIALTIFKYYNSLNVFIKNFYVGRSLEIKKINYRAKGKIDFIKKRYSNIIIITYGEKN